MKVKLNIEETGVTCGYLLPVLYFSFLRKENVDRGQFDDYFENKNKQLLKSKIFTMVHEVACRTS